MLKRQHAHAADADDGEEVSEPTMFHRRYAGHLNLSTATMHDTLPLTPQLAFLGHHSGEQRAARVARYQRFAPPACCAPRPHAQRGWQHASQDGSDDGRLQATAGLRCLRRLLRRPLQAASAGFLPG